KPFLFPARTRLSGGVICQGALHVGDNVRPYLIFPGRLVYLPETFLKGNVLRQSKYPGCKGIAAGDAVIAADKCPLSFVERLRAGEKFLTHLRRCIARAVNKTSDIYNNGIRYARHFRAGAGA